MSISFLRRFAQFPLANMCVLRPRLTRERQILHSTSILPGGQVYPSVPSSFSRPRKTQLAMRGLLRRRCLRETVILTEYYTHARTEPFFSSALKAAVSDSRDRRLRAHNDSALALPPAGLPASCEQYKSGAHRSARHKLTPDFLTRIHSTGPAEMAARTVALILALTTAASALTDAAQNLYGSQQSFRFTAQASFSLCRYGRTDIELDLLHAGFPTQPPHWQGCRLQTTADHDERTGPRHLHRLPRRKAPG